MSAFAGTGSLIRLILRRDRVRLPVWILGIAVFVLGSISSFPTVYGTEASRQARAALMSNPASVVLTGPGYGLHDYTFGAMTANEMGGFTAVAFAFMGVLLLVRHTRAEEEYGRAELVGAAVVGRHAPLTAALVVVLAANVVAGAVLAAGLPLTLPQLSVSGSVLFAAAMAAVGITFTGVAAVTAQLMEHARAAKGLALTLVAVAFALRAAGDLAADGPGNSGLLSWLSPIGWAQATRAYVDGRWWPLLPAVGLTVVLLLASYALRSRRDLDAGWVRARPGRPTASVLLSGPTGLAFRLQRGVLTGWTLGFAAFGLFVGAIAEQAARFIETNEAAQRYFAQLGAESSSDTMIATYMSMMAVVATGYALQAVATLRAEESSGRLEQLLGGLPLSRGRWASSVLLTTLVGTVLVLGAGGLGGGVVYAATNGDPGEIARVLGAALVHVPAIWVLTGLTVALFGLLPAATGLGWAALVGVVFIDVFGPLLQLPEWISRMSPFWYTPMLPIDEFSATPLAILTAVAAALMVAGVAGFRRRDLA